MPLIARDLLGGGSSTYGLLLAAFGGGAVTGAFASAKLRERLTGEAVVATSSAAFAVAGLVAAWSPSAFGTMAALSVCGGAWVLALSQFNITVQIRTPRWVVGRELAIYQAAAFAGLAAGAWAWGVAADRFGLSVSLSGASLLLLATTLAGLIVRMPTTRSADLEGGTHRPASPDAEIDPTSGPVVVSIEYRIPVAQVPAFLNAASRLRRTRRRNGARRWALLQDAAHPEVWIERFEVSTWLDYLRHVERTTSVDVEVARRVLAFHNDTEPPVTRFLLAHVPEGGGTDQSCTGVFERAVYDQSLSPTVTADARNTSAAR